MLVTNAHHAMGRHWPLRSAAAGGRNAAPEPNDDADDADEEEEEEEADSNSKYTGLIGGGRKSSTAQKRRGFSGYNDSSCFGIHHASRNPSGRLDFMDSLLPCFSLLLPCR